MTGPTRVAACITRETLASRREFDPKPPLLTLRSTPAATRALEPTGERHETFNDDAGSAAADGSRGGLHNHGNRNRRDAQRRGPRQLQLEELRFRLRNHERNGARWQNLQRTVLSDHEGYDRR